jgi:hypothetical protein
MIVDIDQETRVLVKTVSIQCEENFATEPPQRPGIAPGPASQAETRPHALMPLER